MCELEIIAKMTNGLKGERERVVLGEDECVSRGAPGESE